MKPAAEEGSKSVPRYFDVEHSPMGARVIEHSGVIDALDLKLMQIESIASLLIADEAQGVRDSATMGAFSAVQMIARECKALSRALWEQQTSIAERSAS